MAYNLNITSLARELRGKPAAYAGKLRAQAEAFWASRVQSEIQTYIDHPRHRDTRMEAGEPVPPPLPILATAAYGMLHVLALGGWQGTQIIAREYELAGETRLQHRPGLALSTDWAGLNRVLGKLAREQTGNLDLPQWIAEQLKFPAAFARTFGVQPEYAAAYIQERLPPIVDATYELQQQVRDAVGAAAQTAWDPEQLEEELQRIGGVSKSRAVNQMRTESSTLWTRGRMTPFLEDDAIVGWRFLVTDDARTTEICRQYIGVVIARNRLTAVPPFHYQCRTQVVPIFRWQANRYPQLAAGGDNQPQPMDGFGQGEWLNTKQAAA